MNVGVLAAVGHPRTEPPSEKQASCQLTLSHREKGTLPVYVRPCGRSKFFVGGACESFSVKRTACCASRGHNPAATQPAPVLCHRSPHLPGNPPLPADRALCWRHCRSALSISSSPRTAGPGGMFRGKHLPVLVGSCTASVPRKRLWPLARNMNNTDRHPLNLGIDNFGFISNPVGQ